MSTTTLEEGQILNLTVRFGNQERTKCAACKRYFSPTGENDPLIAHCQCGASYSNEGDGKFKVLNLP